MQLDRSYFNTRWEFTYNGKIYHAKTIFGVLIKYFKLKNGLEV